MNLQALFEHGHYADREIPGYAAADLEEPNGMSSGMSPDTNWSAQSCSRCQFSTVWTFLISPVMT